MREFRTAFSPRRPQCSAPGTFTTGAGRAAAVMQTREAVPLIMAGVNAVAGLPDEQPRVAGRRITRWAVGFALVLLGAVSTQILQSGGTPRAKLQVTAPTPVESAYARGVEQMRTLMEQFFAASSPEEKARFVRGGAAMLPAMREWYAAHPDESGSFHLEGTVNIPDGRGFVMVRGVNDAGRTLQALLEETPGGWLLDWRSCTGAGDLPWDRWLTARPPQPVTQRVVAMLDSVYPAPWDEAKFLCLKISNAADTAGAWAYVERATAAGQELAALLSPPPGGPPVRNRLRFTGVFSFPAEAASPSAATCVQLHSLTSKSWRDDTPEAAGPVVASAATR